MTTKFLYFVTCVAASLSMPLALFANGWSSQEDDSPPISVTELDLRIDQLDATEFAIREAATSQLIAAGKPAIERLEYRLPSLSAESTYRAIHVIDELCFSRNRATQDFAEATLRVLADEGTSNFSFLARSMIPRLDERRSSRAVEELRRLGAVISHQTMRASDGQLINAVFGLEIGDEWIGTREDFSLFEDLTGVTQLTLKGQMFDDESVGPLLANSNLRTLSLVDTVVTDAAFEQFFDSAGKTQLLSLEIKYSPVGNELASRLSELTSLVEVSLYGTNVSREAAASLKQALPTVLVDHRQGGFLGIRCLTEETECRVTAVEEGSAAAAAGVRIDDVIRKFNGIEISSIEGLIEITSELRAGTEVRVELERRQDYLTLSFRLGRWE